MGAETKIRSPDTQTQTLYDGQTPQTRGKDEELPMQYPLQTGETHPESFEVVSHEQQGAEERMDTSEEYVHFDVPSKPISHCVLN